MRGGRDGREGWAEGLHGREGTDHLSSVLKAFLLVSLGCFLRACGPEGRSERCLQVATSSCNSGTNITRPQY